MTNTFTKVTLGCKRQVWDVYENGTQNEKNRKREITPFVPKGLWVHQSQRKVVKIEN